LTMTEWDVVSERKRKADDFVSCVVLESRS
jgi:hypothetical protein